MRKSNFEDDKRCYDCGNYHFGILFGKYQRLICKGCLEKRFDTKTYICCECNMEKNCTIHGKENEELKDYPIFICQECIDKAKSLLI